MPDAHKSFLHSAPDLPAVLSPPVSGRQLLAALLIAALALAAYLPSRDGGFIIDDSLYVTDSPLIQASDGLYRFWFTTEPVDYWPLTNSTFWIEWRLWGMNPTGYHVTNLVLHIVGALLIWAILSMLQIPGAWLAALLFAVHPVNVESVAWISQRKNVLSMLFFLLSILWYLQADRGPGPWYWFSFVAFILAMLSKGSVAILPFVLLLLVWWQRGGIGKRDLLRTAPFFLVAVVLAAVNVWFQTHGSEQVIRNVTFMQRLLGAGAAVWFYLYKALLPVNLIFFYPQWNIETGDWRWWLPLLATVGVTALLFWRRNTRFGRPLFFAWAFFCVALVPVLGFTDVGFMKYSLVADRYQHIAIIGVVTLAAAGASLLYQRWRGPARSASVAAAALVVAMLTLLSWRQSSLYANAITLYEATLAKNPDAGALHNNLAIEYSNIGRSREAIQHCEQSLRVMPDDYEAHNNLGIILVAMGRTQDAIDHYQQALLLKPDFSQAHNNLASVLVRVGRLPEAIQHYEQSLQLKPFNPKVRNNLGAALVANGLLNEAIAQFEESLWEDPDYAETHLNLANALAHAGRSQDAIEHYARALQLKPDYYQAFNNLGATLFNAGQTEEAIARFQEAVRLKPDYAEAYHNLGKAHAQAKRLNDAIHNFQRALTLKPDYADAYSGLGNALIEAGRVPEAITQYEKLLQLKPDNLQACLNLAAAYAQIRRFADAVTAAQQALDLARSKNQTALSLEIEQRLKTYRSMLGKESRATPPPNESP